jgi:cytochrome c-type biogenesis protein CcmH
VRLALVFAVVVALCAAGAAWASEQNPTLAEVEAELYCPTCDGPLRLSDAPVADRIRSFIRARIEAGDTKSEIKDKLVESFGVSVLAAPPKEGFNLLAWVLPLAGGFAAVVVLGFAVRRWSRSRTSDEGRQEAEPSANGRGPLDPDLERRLDEELARFDG